MEEGKFRKAMLANLYLYFKPKEKQSNEQTKQHLMKQSVAKLCWTERLCPVEGVAKNKKLKIERIVGEK